MKETSKKEPRSSIRGQCTSVNTLTGRISSPASKAPNPDLALTSMILVESFSRNWCAVRKSIIVALELILLGSPQMLFRYCNEQDCLKSAKFLLAMTWRRIFQRSSSVCLLPHPPAVYESKYKKTIMGLSILYQVHIPN